MSTGSAERFRVESARAPSAASVLTRAPLRERAFVVVSTVAVLALGFLFLGRKSIWLDEAFSVAAARLSWGDLFALLWDSQANAGLYYVLLHPWLVFGEDEFAVRSLSVLFAAATMPFFYALGARLFGRPTAVVASVLLALNASFVTYAQEARTYTLVVFLVVLSSYLLLLLLERPTPLVQTGYVIVTALAVYAHFLAALVAVAHALALLVSQRPVFGVRRIVLTYSLWLVLVSPIALYVLGRDIGQLEWLARPDLLDVAAAFAVLSGGRAAVFGYFVISALALLALWRSRGGLGGLRRDWPFVFVLTWLLVPVTVSLAVSLVKPVFLGKYVLFTMPALVLLAAVGVTSLGTRRRATIALTALVALAVLELGRWYLTFDKSEWRDAAHYTVAESRPGDRIAFYQPYVRLPFEYYVLEGDPTKAPEPTYPAAEWGKQSLLDEDLNLPYRSLIRETTGGGGRLWLVLSSVDAEDAGRAERDATRDAVKVGEREFVDVTVQLYRRNDD